MTPSILVLGVGNVLLGDEGIGPCAIRELERRYRFSPEIRLLDGGTAGLGLLPHLLQVEKLLVIDAICAGGPPGRLITLRGDELPAGLERKLSPHQIGLGDLMALARLQGAPKEVVVMGLEPETLGLGLKLSKTVAGALGALIDACIEQLRRWGVRAEPVEASSLPALEVSQCMS